jgi:hypothetical protein
MPKRLADAAAIEAGMDRYAVLLFCDQRITDEEQKAFTRNFGKIEDARSGNITMLAAQRAASRALSRYLLAFISASNSPALISARMRMSAARDRPTAGVRGTLG